MVWYATIQLATQVQQRRIQVVRNNKVARKRLTESNGTPAMDLGHFNVVDCCFEVDIRIRNYTNKREIDQNTHP